MTTITEGQIEQVEEAPRGDIRPERVFVRILTLPTQAARQARAAVEMQLDRLSPIPRRSAHFDLFALGSDGAATRYATGIITRQTLRDAANDHPLAPALKAFVEVEGAPVAFCFPNEVYQEARRAKWFALAPNLLIAAAAVSLLIAGIDHRLKREVRASAAQLTSLQQDLQRRSRIDGEHRSAWSSWSSARSDEVAQQGRCALSKLDTGDNPPPISRLEFGGAFAKVFFARSASASFRKAVGGDGVSWAPGNPQSLGSVLTVSRGACS